MRDMTPEKTERINAEFRSIFEEHRRAFTEKRNESRDRIRADMDRAREEMDRARIDFDQQMAQSRRRMEKRLVVARDGDGNGGSATGA